MNVRQIQLHIPSAAVLVNGGLECQIHPNPGVQLSQEVATGKINGL